MNRNGIKPLSDASRRLLRNWSNLTGDEQRAAAVILAIFLLGVAARYWHVCLRG